MARRLKTDLDRELAEWPSALRWKEWLRRIEAVLFASARPVSRDAIARVVGQEASVDVLIADLRAELADRPYELAMIGAGWMLRTRPSYAGAIRAAADPPERRADLGEADAALLAAIAYHQPVTRAGLAEIFGREIGRDAIDRLRARGLIGQGPRAPAPGAPQSFVTTDTFLEAFSLASLRDLPDPDADGDPGDPGDGGPADHGAQGASRPERRR